MGRYGVEPSTSFAEVAFVVRGEWQNEGVGHALLKRLAEIAEHKGLARFTATTLVGNQLMLRVFTNSGYRVESELVAGTYALKLFFFSAAAGPP